MFHDITQEVEVERVRDTFTSMLVHELRSPLGAIKQLSEVLMAGKKRRGTKAYKEYVKLINDNASQMLLLVNDILDAARLEAGKFEIQKASTEIAPLVQDRLAFFAPVAEKKNIKLSVVLDPTLSQGYFDESRIDQVLNNLISNALKFTPEGGAVTIVAFEHAGDANIVEDFARINALVPFTLQASAFGELTEGIVVAVIDTGEGIPQAQIGRLFNKFTQVQNHARKHSEPSTGLGLSIAKGIVEAHEGSIGVVSEEGAGSVFFFTLPQKKIISSIRTEMKSQREVKQ